MAGPSSLIQSPEYPESLSKPVFTQLDTTNILKETIGSTVKPVKQILESNSGSFNFEFNKMLFVSGLVQIMEKHNMAVPANLLDNTDFVLQLLGFLEQHGISLPSENVPQFQIELVQSANEENECE